MNFGLASGDLMTLVMFFHIIAVVFLVATGVFLGVTVLVYAVMLYGAYRDNTSRPALLPLPAEAAPTPPVVSDFVAADGTPPGVLQVG